MEAEIEKEMNTVILERILFHLEESTRFCNRLDLSRLCTFERTEWETRLKHCKDAIAFTMEAVQKLKQILE